MKEPVLLLNMFSDYVPPEELQEALSQAAIVAADIRVENRSVHVAAHSPRYIPWRLMEELIRGVSNQYGLAKLEITMTHPATELQKMEPQDLMMLFVSRNSMTRGSLAGARWEWEGDTLTIHLTANGKSALEELVPQVTQELRERFAAPVNIRIEAGNALEGKALFEAMDSMRMSIIENYPTNRPQKAAEAPKVEQDSGTIYGKPFRGKSVPMDEMSMDMGTIIVEGRVFAVDHKDLPKRNAVVAKFDMTDNRNSIRVTRFMEAREAKPILESVKVGSILRVQGKLIEDRYENEMVLKPYAIMPGSMPKRQDTAPGEKRVELHLHTTMSNMDALTETAAAVKQAAAW